MTFEEIVDQAAATPARRGRVTYRVLQRQFALDDAALADLKEELLFSLSSGHRGRRTRARMGRRCASCTFRVPSSKSPNP